MAEVSLRKLRKTYGAVVAVEGVDLEIAKGELIVLLGPSGCGKSTTLRMVAGLETISAGELHIGGRNVTTLEPKDRDIAMVFQNYALYPHKTIRGNMSFGLKMRGMKGARSPGGSTLQRKCWTSRTCSTASRASFQADRCSVSHSAAPLFATRRCFCSMNRCPTWMRSFAPGCGRKSPFFSGVSERQCFTSRTIKRRQ